MASLLADLVLVLHAAFIVWVVLGVFFLARRPRLRRLHLASVLYGLAIEVWPWVCPLTHLEQRLRDAAGEGSYRGGFLTHYLERFVYLEAPRELLAGAAALVVGYTLALNWRWRRRAAEPRGARTGCLSGCPPEGSP